MLQVRGGGTFHNSRILLKNSEATASQLAGAWLKQAVRVHAGIHLQSLSEGQSGCAGYVGILVHTDVEKRYTREKAATLFSPSLHLSCARWATCRAIKDGPNRFHSSQANCDMIVNRSRHAAAP
jgi:hypothetical protein